MKLHLVDATYELFRAFFAMPSIEGAGGQEVGAVQGLLSSMLKLLRQDDCTHLGCATDHEIESFRNDLFASYKTGAGMDPDLWSQFPLAEEGLRALGLVVWPMVEFEADDALAAAAARWRHDVDQVLICTPDKDLAQCVRDQAVVLWDRRREIVYDQAAVRAKWGVAPTSIPDYLALIGDNADGIPGIPAWGAKSAGTVLTRYGAIEEIPADPAEWDVKVRGAKRLAQNLEAQRDDALLYKTLATLRSDVPLTESLADLEWRGTPRAEWNEFCARYGFRGLAGRPHRWAE